jgi:protease IV
MREMLRPLALVVAVGIISFGVFAASLSWYGNWQDVREARVWPISDGYCNIAVVPIKGDIIAYDGDYLYGTDDSSGSAPITTSGDWVEGFVRFAEADPDILGIVAQIDSYGGYAAPGYQIMEALRYSSLPTVAYIRETGASAAYLAATGADYIVASPFAAVGSIGITYSYVENAEQNEKEGKKFVQLSSGPFKDAGNPNKALTPSERALYERDIQIYKDMFVQQVAAARGLSVEAVEAIADGSVMPASLALEKGLIDEIGTDAVVRAWFGAEWDLDPEAIVLCE